MMKKRLSLLLALVLVVSLFAGCGKTETKTEEKKEETKTETTKEETKTEA